MDIFLEDKRLNISPAYLRPGFAFGGSCLPKDLRALTHLAKSLDLSLPVISNVQVSNRMLIERGADWILSGRAKRIGFLGISFKSGTDDVRESSFVEIVERLLGKGREVRIFDPNVQLAKLVGANKEYLMSVLPHVASLLVPNISDVMDWAEVVVSTTPDPVYRSGVETARRYQTVLDFAGFKSQSGGPNIEGFLW
jgi:GDP-mannose 6-dehydrogenase